MTIRVWQPGIATQGQQAKPITTDLFHDALKTPSFSPTAKEMSANGEIQTIVFDRSGTTTHLLRMHNVPHVYSKHGHLMGRVINHFPKLTTMYIDSSFKFHKSEIPLIVNFVEAGGHLVTSGKRLYDLIEKAFPHLLFGRGLPTRGEVDVDVCRYPAMAPIDPLAGMFAKNDVWRLDGRYAFDVIDLAVHIQMGSSELQQEHGTGNIQVAFPWGKGWVTHMISSMWMQINREAGKQPYTPAYYDTLGPPPRHPDAIDLPRDKEREEFEESQRPTVIDLAELEAKLRDFGVD